MWVSGVECRVFSLVGWVYCMLLDLDLIEFCWVVWVGVWLVYWLWVVRIFGFECGWFCFVVILICVVGFLDVRYVVFVLELVVIFSCWFWVVYLWFVCVVWI